MRTVVEGAAFRQPSRALAGVVDPDDAVRAQNRSHCGRDGRNVIVGSHIDLLAQITWRHLLLNFCCQIGTCPVEKRKGGEDETDERDNKEA